MAKLTLLDLTQRILSDMNGDEVNDISDTAESLQVASIIRDVYQEIIGSRKWPHLNQLMSPSPQGATYPTHINLSDTWVYIDSIRYNVKSQTATDDSYDVISYMEPDDFLELLNSRNSSASNVDEISDPSTGIPLLIINDHYPQYWTTFDDETLVFDSYDSVVETNLQESKFQIWGNVEPTWTHTSIAVPDLPAKAFPYLLAEAKSVAFNALMQVGNQKAEQQSRRQRVWLGREKWRSGRGQQFPNYGRGSAK